MIHIRRPIFLDTTLRDGEQCPGIYLTRKSKVELAQKLDSLGVDILEVGVPAMGIEERQTLREIRDLGLKADVLVWNRLSSKDADLCREDGHRHLHFAVPSSRVHLEKKLGRDEDWLWRELGRVVGRSVRDGAMVSVGAEDASRADPEFLAELFRRAADLGAIRVRYADTLGILTPDDTSRIIAGLKKEQPLPIDFHAHDDFGLATANALAAYDAGAEVLSCSLLGLGERAGNASLEELVGVFHFLRHDLPDWDVPGLVELCRRLAEKTGEPIPARKPLVGDRIFTHESGIHVDGLIKDPITYEAFPPETMGGQRRLVAGKHSGRSALLYLASQAGRTWTNEKATRVLGELRRRLSQEEGLNPHRLFLEALKESGGEL